MFATSLLEYLTGTVQVGMMTLRLGTENLQQLFRHLGGLLNTTEAHHFVCHIKNNLLRNNTHIFRTIKKVRPIESPDSRGFQGHVYCRASC
jgi:hypothetical protein